MAEKTETVRQLIERRRASRRDVLRGTGLAALTILTPLGTMTPREAHAAQTPLTSLTESEAQTLEALTEVLVPGATEAGVLQFVDAQLGSRHPLLVLPYLGYTGDFTAFYHGGLAALEALAQERSGQAFAELSSNERADIAGELFAGEIEGWQGPPPFLFYFASRSDAIDVTYGTPEGFAALGIPYLAHIQPPRGWTV